MIGYIFLAFFANFVEGNAVNSSASSLVYIFSYIRSNFKNQKLFQEERQVCFRHKKADFNIAEKSNDGIYSAFVGQFKSGNALYFFNCYVCIEKKDPLKASSTIAQAQDVSDSNVTTTTTTSTTTTTTTTTTGIDPISKSTFPCDIVYEDNIQVMNFNKPFPRELARFSMDIEYIYMV